MSEVKACLMHNAVVVVESVQLMGPGEGSLNKPV